MLETEKGYQATSFLGGESHSLCPGQVGLSHSSTNSSCFFGAKFNLLIMPITSAHTYVFLYQRHKLPYHQESF